MTATSINHVSVHANDLDESVAHPGRPDPAQRYRPADRGLAAARPGLADPPTFPRALDGLDRLFVMTGYTVAMTHQTKMITDAAADAGAGHLVHLGIFGDGRSTEPHFAWHELVERYIE